MKNVELITKTLLIIFCYEIQRCINTTLLYKSFLQELFSVDPSKFFVVFTNKEQKGKKIQSAVLNIQKIQPWTAHSMFLNIC